MQIFPWVDWCFNHARTVLLILFFLILSGSIAYYFIPKESTPDIKIPMIYVSATYEGICPHDAERLILKPLEQKLRNIDGVKKLSSVGFEGGGYVTVEFMAGHSVDKARQDVREKVEDAKGDLPQDMRAPSVHEINLGQMPVLVVMLSGQVPDDVLFKEAHRLKEAIEEQVSSVLEAKLVGHKDEQVEIIISPEKMEFYQLSFDEVLQSFSRNNVMVSAGKLNGPTGAFTVRVLGLVETIQDILEMPLISQKEASVKLKDVVEVRKTYKDPESLARGNGVKTVSLEISKRTGENVINTVQAVRHVVTQAQKKWPPHLNVSYSNDDSRQILDMVKDLKNHLISAVLLVMVIVLLSLGVRSTLLVGVAIPGSFLTSILLISLMGFTLNMVVLFGLILSVGMLVDGAIIVVEYADRKMAQGQNRRKAYAVASTRMLWPVITSVSTIIVVFLPLIFWPGVVGEFMKFLPYTLVATLSASLLMALIFVPTLGSLFGGLPHKSTLATQSISPLQTENLKSPNGLSALYSKGLNKALDRPSFVIGGAAFLLILSILAYNKFGRGIEFFPNVDPDRALIFIRSPGNFSIEQKDSVVKQVEKKILPMKDFSCVYATTLHSQQEMSHPEDTIGLINIEFNDWQKRRNAQEILSDLESKLKDIPGVIIEIQKEKQGPGDAKPIAVEFSSDTPEELQKQFLTFKAFAKTVPGMTNVEDNLSTPGISWELSINRAEAARFGVDVAALGELIKLITNGMKLTQYRPLDSREEIDIVVRCDEDHRSMEALNRFKIHTKKGTVPISLFVEKKMKPKLALIHRAEGQRVLTLKSDVKNGFLAHDIIGSLKNWLKETRSHHSVHVSFKGEEEDKQETGQFLFLAFGTAVFIMTVILVTQFNSFFSAMLILSSVIMSTIGVLVGLIVMQVPFSIVMCGIGIIALAGIIVSNNIILIDTFDQLALQCDCKRDAIIKTGLQRLRPVILTKLTAILGLLPIMFRVDIDYLSFQVHIDNPSTLWWQQIAISIVFGVAFASLLTLFVTPCALMLRENFRAKKIMGLSL